MAAMLEVSNLKSWYGESQALHGVDLTVGEGETITIFDSEGYEIGSDRQAHYREEIIGWIVLVVAAGGLFGALQEALNTVWEVPADPKAGWLKMVRERFVSFALIAGIALVVGGIVGAVMKQRPLLVAGGGIGGLTILVDRLGWFPAAASGW